eukprot:5681587-Prymnesium_polylepis.1
MIGGGGEATALLIARSCGDAPAAGAAPEPFAWLHGAVPATGAASTAALGSPDPLVNVQWGASVNRSKLQVYAAAPQGWEVEEGTSSFAGLASLASGAPAVVVSGGGRLRFDFGAERAAWLEVDSPDLSAAAAEWLTLSISEYTYPWQGKTLRPIKYDKVSGGAATYRLETNRELYEGVRYGWLSFNPPAGHQVAPWTISAVRLVAKVKPVNYTASYAPDDAQLGRVWAQVPPPLLALHVFDRLLSATLGARHP